jgi:hypothetical protein
MALRTSPDEVNATTMIAASTGGILLMQTLHVMPAPSLSSLAACALQVRTYRSASISSLFHERVSDELAELLGEAVSVLALTMCAECGRVRHRPHAHHHGAHVDAGGAVVRCCSPIAARGRTVASQNEFLAIWQGNPFRG